MRKSIPFLLLLTSIFIVQACTNPFSGDDSMKKVHGKVYDVFEGDTLLISGANILVDGEIVAKTKDGNFSFTKQAGEYNLQVNSEFHESLNMQLTVKGKDSTNLQLVPLFQEYFPLEQGYNWNYKYSGFEYDDHRENGYEGSRIVEIINEVKEGSDIIYSFEITDSITAYRNMDVWDEETDEVIRVQDTIHTVEAYTALVREKANERLIVESELNPFFVLTKGFTWWDDKGNQKFTPLFKNLPLSRFKNEIEIMIGGTSVYPGNMRVGKNKGVVSFGHSGGHLDKYGHSYQLQSTNFN